MWCPVIHIILWTQSEIKNELSNVCIIMRLIKVVHTFSNAYYTVRWECWLIVIDVDDIYPNGRRSCQLGNSFICCDHSQTIGVSDFSVQYDVCLHQSWERRLDHKCIIMVSIYNMVQQPGICTLIDVSGRYLKNIKLIQCLYIWCCMWNCKL